MKTKKLLSLVLSLVLVFSMMATLGISASAANAECTDCNHTGKVNCNECHGTGLMACFNCQGSGQCAECGGTGKIKWCDECDGTDPLCQHCSGDGFDTCCSCYGYGTCCECDGEKNISCENCYEGKVNCTVCNGTGYTTVPDECYLDLDASTTDIPEKKELDQNYNLTVNEVNGNDVTKVKLSWEINDINAVRMDNKVWDTTELKWVVASSNTTIMDKGTAKFTLENYSSVEIDANAKFEALTDKDVDIAYDESTGTDGTITLDTANGSEVYGKTNVPTGKIIVTVTPSCDYFKDKTATTAAVKYGTYTVTIEEHQDNECLAAGTKITMADGSLKNIEDIAEGEYILTFNHETGEYEAQEVDLAYAGEGKDYGTELTFSDGTTLTIVGEHDLFEKESMKYVTITRANAKANIGKQYYNAETGKFVELTSVKTTSPVNYYSLYTKYNYNCIANGMLTVPDDVDYMLNIYQFNDDLTSNEAQLQKDIASYGIYEYRSNAPYSKAEYDMMNMKYVNIVIGKGLATFEELFDVRDEYLELR